jgi:hypothetical protein
MPTEFCRHIRTNGLRCRAFALRDKPFCYPHEKANAHHRNLKPQPDRSIVIHDQHNDPDYLRKNPLVADYYDLKPKALHLDFPPLEDRQSIQVALSMLLTALAQDRIDAKRAGPILYGLQVASANAKTLTSSSETQSIREVVTDESGHELAPDEDPTEEVDGSPIGPAERMLMSFRSKIAERKIAELTAQLEAKDPDNPVLLKHKEEQLKAEESKATALLSKGSYLPHRIPGVSSPHRTRPRASGA